MRLVPFGLSLLLLAFAVTVAAEPVATPSQPPSAQASAAAPLDINTATATQLEALPGIGPATAKRILEYREKNGSFKKIEELMNVPGIGEKSFLKLKPLITVTPPRAKSGSGRETVA
jgi:competence protein ComEA